MTPVHASHRYAVYGACLASELLFPELPAADAGATPRWEFTTTRALAPMQDESVIGDDQIYGSVHARLFAHAAGHRIVVDDTGVFDISADRRRLQWEQRADAWPDFVRSHLTGRVVATALYLDGLLPLHGSAVETADGVIGFLAPKGYGKSTLAWALTQAGARLVTDDTLPVELPTRDPDTTRAPSVRAWPGVHSMRLKADALRAVGDAPQTLGTNEGKQVVADLPEARRLAHPRPLVALYLLDPVHPDGIEVQWVALPPMLAAISVVAHVKIGRMLGAAAAPVMLERAASIAHAVPVRRLQMPRELDRVRTIADTILSWHGGVA